MTSTRVSLFIHAGLVLAMLGACSSTEEPLPRGPAAIGQVSGVVGSPSVVRRNQRYIIDVKSRIYPGDIIETDTAARAHLAMIDGSVIALGNRTSFVLHEFDIAKAAHTRAAMVLSRGTMRLTVSKALEQGAFEIRTPMATIRFADGDIWAGLLSGDNALDVAMLQGSGVNITDGRFSADVSRPGEGISVIRGSGPQAVAPWPARKVSEALGETAIPAP